MWERDDCFGRDKKWISVARKFAFRSNCRQKHGALLVSSGRLLNASWNSTRNSPLITESPRLEASFHAEIALIRSLGWNSKEISGNTTLYVARINGRNSFPCNRCLEQIVRFGIRRIVWTSEASNVVCSVPPAA